MILKKILSSILILSLVFAQPIIKCGISQLPDEGCLFGLYNDNLENSHVSLCNISSQYYYNCYITNNGVSVPISFTTNCDSSSKPIVYLYQEKNSHVSLVKDGSITICLDNRFSKIFDVQVSQNNLTGWFPLFGTYYIKNSHIEGEIGNYTVFLRLLDNISPTIDVTPLNNSILILPTKVKVIFKDNNGLYLCGYRTSTISKVFKCSNSEYSLDLPITLDICPTMDCAITFFAYDLSLNYNEKKYHYKVVYPKIKISTTAPSYIDLSINSKVKYEITVYNEGTTKLENVTIQREGCDSVGVYINNQEISFPYNIGTLSPGEKKSLELEIDPYKISVCTLRIKVNAKDSVSGRIVGDFTTIYLRIYRKNIMGVLITSEKIINIWNLLKTIIPWAKR